VIPGELATAIINNSRTANITTNAVSPITTLRVGNQNHATQFGALNVGADLEVSSNIQIASGENSKGSINHTSGMLSFGNNFQISAVNPGTDASYTISGGTLSGPTGNIAVGTTSTGLFHVIGNDASISANSMNIGATATIRFSLADIGVSKIELAAGLNISDGANLVVDGSSYQGTLESITLIQAATINGNFGQNVTFENFGELNPQLSQVGGSLMVIPEPRVYGLAFGLLALAWIVGRRRIAVRS
jgi:hypothetical protein